MPVNKTELRLPVDASTTPGMVVDALLTHPKVKPTFEEQVKILSRSKEPGRLWVGFYDGPEGKQIVLAHMGLAKNVTVDQTLRVLNDFTNGDLTPVAIVKFPPTETITPGVIETMNDDVAEYGVPMYIFATPRTEYDPGQRKLAKRSVDLLIIEKTPISMRVEPFDIAESMSEGEIVKLFAENGFKVTRATIPL